MKSSLTRLLLVCTLFLAAGLIAVAVLYTSPPAVSVPSIAGDAQSPLTQDLTPNSAVSQPGKNEVVCYAAADPGSKVRTHAARATKAGNSSAPLSPSAAKELCAGLFSKGILVDGAQRVYPYREGTSNKPVPNLVVCSTDQTRFAVFPSASCAVMNLKEIA